MNKQEYVNSLRELADYVEGKDLPDDWKESTWSETRGSYPTPELEFRVADKHEFGGIVAALGAFDKQSTDYRVNAVVQLSDGATLTVSIPHEQICKKVVVGKKTVPFQPAFMAQAVPEHEEDIVKWECPESFIALKGEQNDSSK